MDRNKAAPGLKVAEPEATGYDAVRTVRLEIMKDLTLTSYATHRSGIRVNFSNKTLQKTRNFDFASNARCRHGGSAERLSVAFGSIGEATKKSLKLWRIRWTAGNQRSRIHEWFTLLESSGLIRWMHYSTFSPDHNIKKVVKVCSTGTMYYLCGCFPFTQNTANLKQLRLVKMAQVKKIWFRMPHFRRGAWKPTKSRQKCDSIVCGGTQIDKKRHSERYRNFWTCWTC
jgi:hypothetical protein